MFSERALEFLKKHKMNSHLIDPAECSEAMLEDMKRGLAGEKSDMPMIPTYLSNDGVLPVGEPVIVIDAGGTNFRCGVLDFTDEGYEVSGLYKQKMPGIDAPCSWDGFVAFIVDKLQPILNKSDYIGFCFSFNADVTPDIDAKVIKIDKEVVITGSEGQLVGASINAELRRRGLAEKKIVILNDTAAVLLGGAALINKERFSGFIGQVSGTGTNTCTSLPVSAIGKLGLQGERGMLVNLESGSYRGIKGGDFDAVLDANSHDPNTKLFEKLTAGVYLGELGRLILHAAAEEGCLSEQAAKYALGITQLGTATINAWADGEEMECFGDDPEDANFVRTVSRELLKRSARCMSTNLIAIGRLLGEGKDPAKPICVLAEGSLVQKSTCYRNQLERMLDRYGAEKLGVHIYLNVGQETTLTGSAAASLLNA